MSTPAPRTAHIDRKTTETAIALALDLDGDGRFEGTTGLGFFDHMLTLLARHGGLGLRVEATGDLNVDCHHTVEDVGIVLGQALAQAAGNKVGIARYGHMVLPMEESLCECTIDFCGRPYLYFAATFERPEIGGFATEVVEDFFRAVCNSGGLTMHLECRRGRNSHHIVEGLFKAFARALRAAVARDGRVAGVPSTKGLL